MCSSQQTPFQEPVLFRRYTRSTKKLHNIQSKNDFPVYPLNELQFKFVEWKTIIQPHKMSHTLITRRSLQLQLCKNPFQARYNIRRVPVLLKLQGAATSWYSKFCFTTDQNIIRTTSLVKVISLTDGRFREATDPVQCNVGTRRIPQSECN